MPNCNLQLLEKCAALSNKNSVNWPEFGAYGHPVIVTINKAEARRALSQFVIAVDERSTLGSVVSESQLRLKRMISELSTYDEMSTNCSPAPLP